jgi:16S rRNA (guanine527-N7)-methyltransferase
MSKDSIWLQGVLQSNDVSIVDSQRNMLERYCLLLLDWNQKINLISRKSEDSIWEEQILHSVSFLSRIALSDSASVIDIGTGGGLPGIPLKIVLPGLRMTLIDSIGKKVNAVQSIIGALGIQDVEVIWTRAEDLNHETGGRRSKRLYDYVICRAVGGLVDLWKYGYPLLRDVSSAGVESGKSRKQSTSGKIIVPRGAILALKGGDIEKELIGVRNMSNISITVIEISLTTSEMLANNEKKIVIMRPK